MCLWGIGGGGRGCGIENEISQNQGVNMWWWRHRGDECGLSLKSFGIDDYSRSSAPGKRARSMEEFSFLGFEMIEKVFNQAAR